ncbi:alpha/beta fold hydrolase [Streptomyces silvisoli]|uniref:Alpha/beta hydrolase n=1 Tax=Streptomyces silvisoli TaxID=3034235 RepID=A0ABT5ZMA8_9ACTN|nr:alpha/beta hydrolase [Streptomyces silvisoli]MDF3290138.1 alpha/beta hydrolase [Streptomyces silvisoli]
MTAELTDESTSRTVTTHRWKLHYNEAGTGHPIVLLHGMAPGATGWSNFAPNIGPLSQHLRVLAVDMPGWGQSDPARAGDRDHPGAVLELLDTLDIEKAALVGNSMGALTILAVAARYPDRVSHLITTGAGSFAVPPLFAPAGPSQAITLLRSTYQDPSPAMFRKLVQATTFDPSFASDELVQQHSVDAQRQPQHLANAVADLEEGTMLADAGPGPADYARITAPTLLIHGRDDRVVSYEHALRLASLIPDSRLHLFNRCGHWAQLEHAEEFNLLVEQFVSHC